MAIERHEVERLPVVVGPALAVWLTVPEPLAVLAKSPWQSIVWAYVFGAMWGVGAVTS